MLALPPILPPASTVYSVANEQAFRVALLRYFQQQRTDATVVDPGQAPSALNGTLVKSVGGGALGNTMVTEASGVLLVSEALRVTGTTILSSALSVAGPANFDSTVNATGAIASASTVQGTRLISTIATGTAPLTVASTTVVTNLNADLLDGQTGTYYTDPTNLTGFGAAGGYLRSTGSAWARVGIASILTDLLTVDGAGSGLDADLLDGQHGAFYQDAGNLNAGTLLSARLTGAYAGITGIGTLVSGAVPASLVTTGTFGAGDYVFPANLTVTTLLTVGGGAVADTSGSVLLKNASGGVDFAGGPFRITRAISTPTLSLRFAGQTGTVAVPVAPTNTNDIAFTRVQGWDATAGAYVNAGSLTWSAEENWSHTAYGSKLKLENVLSGTTALRTAWEVGGDGAIHFYNDQSDGYSVYFGESFDLIRNSATNKSVYSLLRTRGARGAESAVQSGDRLGVFQWAGWGAGIYVASDIYSDTLENWTGSANGTNMVFRVTPVTTASKVIALTLTSTTGTFIGGVTLAGALAGATTGAFSTSVTSPLFGTTTNVDVVVQRNAVTGLTVGAATVTLAKGDVTLTPVASIAGIHTDTVDGTDTAVLKIGPGSTFSNTRGALVQLHGNEHANTGQLHLGSGNVTGASVLIQNKGTTVVTITDLLATVAGGVVAGTDNTYDLGASGASRFRASFNGSATVTGRTLNTALTLANGDCMIVAGYYTLGASGTLTLAGDSVLLVT